MGAIEARVEVARYLMETQSPEAFMVTFVKSDAASHFFFGDREWRQKDGTMMDGKVITEAFRDEYLEEHPVQLDGEKAQAASVSAPGCSQEEASKVEDRLRDLGYLG